MGEKWAPDMATIRWSSGIIDRDRVRDALRETAARTESVDRDSDRYWDILAEAAIEAVVWNVHEVAAACQIGES